MPVLFPGRPNTSGHHRMEGILAMWGRGVRRGARLKRRPASSTSCPTICELLGLPIAMDLQGTSSTRRSTPASPRPPEALRRKLRPAAPPAGPEESDLDRNVLERLRSLGYINKGRHPPADAERVDVMLGSPRRRRRRFLSLRRSSPALRSGKEGPPRKNRRHRQATTPWSRSRDVVVGMQEAKPGVT